MVALWAGYDLSWAGVSWMEYMGTKKTAITPMPTKKEKEIQKVIAERPREKGRGAGIPKVLIDEAFEMYCNKIPYSKISKELNISKVSICKYVKKQEWAKRRQARWDKTEQKVDDTVASEEAKRRKRHIGLAQALQAKGYEKLKEVKKGEISVTEARTMISDGVKLERELHGESTAEVQIAIIFPQELQDI